MLMRRPHRQKNCIPASGKKDKPRCCSPHPRTTSVPALHSAMYFAQARRRAYPPGGGYAVHSAFSVLPRINVLGSCGDPGGISGSQNRGRSRLREERRRKPQKKWRDPAKTREYLAADSYGGFLRNGSWPKPISRYLSGFFPLGISRPLWPEF